MWFTEIEAMWVESLLNEAYGECEPNAEEFYALKSALRTIREACARHDVLPYGGRRTDERIRALIASVDTSRIGTPIGLPLDGRERRAGVGVRRDDRTDMDYGAAGAWSAVERLSYHPQDERAVDLTVRLHTEQTLELELYTEGEGSDYHPDDLAVILAADE